MSTHVVATASFPQGGPLHGASAGSVQSLLKVTAEFALRCMGRSARIPQTFDLGSEASRSQKPHRHLSSGIRTTEQTSWLSSRTPQDLEQLDVRVRPIKLEPGAIHDIPNPACATDSPRLTQKRPLVRSASSG